jgi:ABC-type Fe3+/spermidine/putrescine transport system ATPase subunit
LADRYPRELSGGEQQRVGLARTIVYHPDPVLFDEPLSNLDAKLRRDMRYEIRRLRDELGFTAIYVTHDQEEALALSDRIAVMNQGVIHQIGHPEEVYANPATLFVASFLGNPNCITCTIQELTSAGTIVRVGESKIRSTLVGEGSPGDRAVLIIRPEAVQVGSLVSDALMNEFEGRVTSAGFLGERRECGVRIHDKFDLNVRMSPDQRSSSGDLVSIAIPVQECRVFVDSDSRGGVTASPPEASTAALQG